MKNFIDSINVLGQFLKMYPAWVHYLIEFWILISAIIVIALIFARGSLAVPSMPAEIPKQQSTVSDSTNTTLYQAGRDIIVQPSSKQLQPKTRVLQPAKLAALLKQFKGVFVRVENDAQTEAFAEELRSSFKLAEWRTNSGDVIVDPARFSFEGIKILVHDIPLSSTDSAPQAAEAIVKELRQQNFLANRLPSDTATQENFIRIRVGSIQSQ